MARPTGHILANLRKVMRDTNYVSEVIQAYIVPSEDAHQSEYVAECHSRREFVSGFSGSAGTAIVTDKAAALWTDGRYFLQAESQLDDNWTLMRTGVALVPTYTQWLVSMLSPGSKVGIDPYLITSGEFNKLKDELELDGLSLISVFTNLVDLIWTDRPPPSANPLLTVPVETAGLRWEEKVINVRKDMAEKKCSVLLLSALDDIAWLLNLRGWDIPYNPVFFVYAIVTENKVLIFMDEDKKDSVVLHHLGLPTSSEPATPNSQHVFIYPYDEVKNYLNLLVNETQGKIWLTRTCNHALHSLVPKNRCICDHSPVAKAKCIKNAVEIAGFRNCHVRDSVALCEFLYWLEDQIEVKKNMLSEYEAAMRCNEFRSKQEDFMGVSFETISSTGPNTAIIHYSPPKENSRQISDNDVYLVDSGAQYKDGTTDITRTIHFGTPGEYAQECYTLVLKGHIGVCSAIFPTRATGNSLDAYARQHLWRAGLDYRHGTGHGVGHFLNVHEGPIGIGTRAGVVVNTPGFEAGMIVSDEPGFYEDGKYGFRIENVVLCVKAKTKYNYKETGFLTFEPLNYVPLCRKLIIPEMLTQGELSWINEYHQRCKDITGAELTRQSKPEVLEWLMKQTEPLG